MNIMPFRPIGRSQLKTMPHYWRLSPERRLEIEAVSMVFPFRVNSYLVEQMIDWDAVPDDPIFQLVFPQPDMLAMPDRQRLIGLLKSGAPDSEVTAAISAIRRRQNPHPSGQLDLNVAYLGEHRLPGIQHKYPETVLFFPAQGQTCHAYCNYCFRWVQFVGEPDLKIAASTINGLTAYLRQQYNVTDVLITGGDPLIMSAALIAKYVEPLLDQSLEHIRTIRIGTKSLAYWPYRFVTDSDAAELLEIFARVTRAGKNLAVMAHISHPRELEPDIVRQAIGRIQATGAHIWAQSPVVRWVNDSPDIWLQMWQREVELGITPYYMFVERDTGPREHFEIPLVRTHDLFTNAYKDVSGLARTVRGPVMSATPGKVQIDGVAHVGGEEVLALHFIQGRNPSWVGKPFFARYDADATWLHDLKPAFGANKFFYEDEMEQIRNRAIKRQSSSRE